MDDQLDCRYIDGRDHALDLVASLAESMRRKYEPRAVLRILSDRDRLEKAIYDLDPDYFNDYHKGQRPGT